MRRLSPRTTTLATLLAPEPAAEARHVLPLGILSSPGLAGWLAVVTARDGAYDAVRRAEGP